MLPPLQLSNNKHSFEMDLRGLIFSADLEGVRQHFETSHQDVDSSITSEGRDDEGP